MHLWRLLFQAWVKRPKSKKIVLFCTVLGKRISAIFFFHLSISTLWTVDYTLQTVEFILQTVDNTLQTVDNTLQTAVDYTLYSVKYTL